MNPLKLAALHAYTTLAAPSRQARQRRLASQGRAPICVLFYHRVADTNANAWTIRRDQFRRHVEFCQQNFDLIDLAEVQRRVGSRSDRPAVSLTFDDGYRDNCEFALPLLIQRRIPFTYFVTTSNIRNGHAFNHDQRAGKPLAVNTVSEIRELSTAGIEIGCHTRSHVDFSRVDDPRVVQCEIIDSKDELEQLIGAPVRYFAFPFGMPPQLTPLAIEAIHEAGYEGFCSAYGAYNLVGRDCFHIRRIHGDPEFARLRNWLAFDPRKVDQEPRVRYRISETPSPRCGAIPPITPTAVYPSAETCS